MQIVTLRNWVTDVEDTFDLDLLTDEDATMYIPHNNTPVDNAIVWALYNIHRNYVHTPREALENTLVSIVTHSNTEP